MEILGPLPSATIDFHHLMAMECQNSYIHFLPKQTKWKDRRIRGGQGANGYPQYLAPIETKTFFLKYPTSASASDPPQIFRPSAGPELSAGEAVIRTLQIVVHSVHCKLLLLLHI